MVELDDTSTLLRSVQVRSKVCRYRKKKSELLHDITYGCIGTKSCYDSVLRDLHREKLS